MIYLFALLGAIVMVSLLLLLRAVLAAPFTRKRLRMLGSVSPPAPLAELYAEAEAQLRPLGFEPPQWCLVESVESDDGISPLRALYAHRASATWLLLIPPIQIAAPNRLHASYLSRLRDGRILVSQPFEIFHQATNTDEVLGQALSEAGFADQLAAHQRWVAGLGEPDPGFLDQTGIAEAMVEMPERHRQALIARGDLRPQTDEVATMRLGFALRYLRHSLRTPKPPADPRPLPPARLALLARQLEGVQHRSPPSSVQWLLFSLSSLLFVLLGWLLWDLQFALVLLLVIAFHECGHFLAMRAFGYRNVHMLLLPLVGGVAIGHDANPNAWRSAWMSLMGPLPGIILGWLLVALLWSQPGLREQLPILTTLTLVLLIVNYLNVLPVPPLDGSHVVQALLPTRLAWLQVGFVAVAAVLGALLAWWLDFFILTVLALLQLFSLGRRYRLLRASSGIAAELPPPTAAPTRRLSAIYAALEARFGPATASAVRIGEGRELLQIIDTQGMRRWQSAIIGGVYALLLIVPVLGLALVAYDQQESAQTQARYESEAEELAAFEAQARRQSWSTLLAGLDEAESTLPGPADLAERRAAAKRLGQPLPAELAELYAERNGSDALGLVPIAQVDWAKDSVEEHLRPYVEALTVWPIDGAEAITLSLEELQQWWWLGQDFDGQTQLYYWPGDSEHPSGMRLVSSFAESPSGYPDLRSYVESQWAQERLWARVAERQERAQHELEQRLAGESVTALLARVDELDQPKLSWRLLATLLGNDNANASAPTGLTPAKLESHRRRLGELPPGLEQLYLDRNGLLWAGLGELEQVDRLSRRVNSYEDGLYPRLGAVLQSIDAADAQPAHQRAEAFAECLDLSWQYRQPLAAAADYREILPKLLWCPDGAAEPGFYDLQQRLRSDDPYQWLLSRVAGRLTRR